MIAYDFEVFRYDWMVVFIDIQTKEKTVISNDQHKLIDFYENHKNEVFVGFNSRNYDVFVFKAIMLGFNPYDVSNWIINQNKKGYAYCKDFNNIPLLNFDVLVGYHGLKRLEGYMGSDIEETEVDFNISRKLTEEELKLTEKYCTHDVEETIKVFTLRIEEFTSQVELIKMFDLPKTYIGKTKAQLTAKILKATKHDYDDEWDIQLPDTIRIEKYAFIVDWFKNADNHDKTKSLEVDVAGVPHVFAWGGLHGAIEKYNTEKMPKDETLLHVDVNSFYPSIMLRYNLLSRSVSNPELFRDIYNLRLDYKKKKDKKANSLKIVVNATFGAMGDSIGNNLYDPRNLRSVCSTGQLLLLDLIEHLENHCKLIQSNTDGLIIQCKKSDIDLIKSICKEWEIRTGMGLACDEFKSIYQADVNNYLLIDYNNKLEGKNAYKSPSTLDNDLPIVKIACIKYMRDGILPEDTIEECNNLILFQKLINVSDKYGFATHNGKKLSGKNHRVFASTRLSDNGIYKVKHTPSEFFKYFGFTDGKFKGAKFANTPDRLFIDNGSMKGKTCPPYLDKNYYIELTYTRLERAGVTLKSKKSMVQKTLI